MGLADSAFGLFFLITGQGRRSEYSGGVWPGWRRRVVVRTRGVGSGPFLAWVVWRFHWTCECHFQVRGQERGGSSEREEGAGGISLICSSPAIIHRLQISATQIPAAAIIGYFNPNM